MSGIAGMVTADGAPVDAELLRRMTDALAFRGPDARHVWKQLGAGFCFTFLCTGPAPQCANQPCMLDGRVWLLADARLDGRDELRQRLEGAGCALREEANDEELILHAWRCWREGCLEIVRGDFAFALWDGESRSLWCVRDPIGVRPFFYTQVGNQLCFSNTLDAVRLAPHVSDALDPRAVGDFLLQGWCADAERTIFRDIRRLPAGHVLHYRAGEAWIRRYAKLPIEDSLELKQPEEYIEAFRELFGAAVRDRVPRDSAAVFMSGGLDSTSVAAVARSVVRRQKTGCAIRAFTLDCRPLFEDEEAQYASRAAAHFGIPIDIFPFAACVPYARWGTRELRQPEPCHEPYLAAQLDQYRQVAAHARVALSGDGGDPILNGQAWPHLVFLTKRMHFGTLFHAFGGYIAKRGRVPPLRGGFRTRVRNWLGRDKDAAHFPNWLNPTFERENELRDRWHELQQAPAEEHPLHPFAYATLTSSYWPSLLEGEEAGWTKTTVEPRAPFLDWRVLRFLLRVPPVPWCMGKDLLRRSMKGLLPEEVRLRPKTPLKGDPLVFHLQRGDWHPLPLHPPVPVINSFVNWKELEQALAIPSKSQLWLDLQPVSLNYWLKTGLPFSRVTAEDAG